MMCSAYAQHEVKPSLSLYCSHKFVSTEMHGFAAEKLQDVMKSNVLSKIVSLFDAAAAKKKKEDVIGGEVDTDLSELLNKVKLSAPQNPAKKHVNNRWAPSPGRW